MVYRLDDIVVMSKELFSKQYLFSYKGKSCTVSNTANPFCDAAVKKYTVM